MILYIKYRYILINQSYGSEKWNCLLPTVINYITGRKIVTFFDISGFMVKTYTHYFRYLKNNIERDFWGKTYPAELVYKLQDIGILEKHNYDNGPTDYKMKVLL